jgi:hypothetical protein
MMKSNAVRALCGLVLCCVPALATIPPGVHVRIGGAEILGHNHYLVQGDSWVSVALTADPGTTIGLYAMAVDENGDADQSAVLTLLDVKSDDGRAFGSFYVPKTLAGKRFVLVALATDSEGGISSSDLIRVDVADESLQSPEPEDKKEKAPASDLMNDE